MQIRCGIALDLTRGWHLARGLPRQHARTLVVDLHVQAHEAVVRGVFLVARGVLRLHSFLFLILIVDSIVKLCVVVQHVLTVDLLALVGEDEDVLGHEQVLNAVTLEEVVRDVTLRRVERREDHTLRRVVFYY